jgi:hypothetical protein
MHDEAKMTIGGVLLIVGVLVVLLVLVYPFFQGSQEFITYPYCMSNLRSINSAITLYKSANDGAWPWLYDKMTAWDTTEVGTNRNVSPFGTGDDPNNPKPRSITSLMFMLIRQDQPPGMFRCPSDKNSIVDRDVKATRDDGDKASGVLEGDYYWDFSRPENTSYSWQAPIWKDGRFKQGIDSSETDTVVIADMTPAVTRPGWKPADVTKLDGEAIEAQNSPNHKGKQVNILRIAGNVEQKKRPDVGLDNDNIYTASGDPNTGSQSATSVDIRKHLSPRDTFLIGPVGRKAE